MSEFLLSRDADVILWWFSSIEKALEKIQKIEVFDDRGSVEKWNIFHIHNFADFAANRVNIYILGILMSYYDGSIQLKGL